MQSSKPWNVTVHIKGGENLQHKLPTSLRMDQSKSSLNGIEILSTSDISVLCLNSQGYDYAGDGYLALPTYTLGLVYVVASYQPDYYYSLANFAVVSAHENNPIIIIPNKNVVIQSRGLSYSKGACQYVTLDKLEALYISSWSDLSGTLVTSRNPVAVISGVEQAKPGGSTNRNDFFESILSPVSLWEHYFILTTFGTLYKREGDVFRIFAYQNNTIVETGYWTKILSSLKYTELELGQNLATFVRCSKPCQVVQYIRGEQIGGKNADPSMIVLPSVNQFLSYYRVVLPYASKYYDSITVVIEHKHVKGLYMNGIRLNDLEWKNINRTKYVWTVVRFSDPSTVSVYHTSSAVKFGIFVYGWSNDASYAYPGGFALKKFSSGEYFEHRSKISHFHIHLYIISFLLTFDRTSILSHIERGKSNSNF